MDDGYPPCPLRDSGLFCLGPSLFKDHAVSTQIAIVVGYVGYVFEPQYVSHFSPLSSLAA